jgi:hypothetical protein
MLGPVRPPMSAQLSATLDQLRERLSGQEIGR